MQHENDEPPRASPLSQALLLIGSVALPLLAGGLGAASTDPSWYGELNRPSFAPPAWLFGPVWTALYVMMGVAAWRVWRALGWSGGRKPLALYGAQLLVNACWTPVFFGLRSMGGALAVIVALELLILATIRAFLRVDRAAGALLVPYAAWVAFATALNASLWSLNP